MATLDVVFTRPPHGQEASRTFTKRPLGLIFVQRMPLVITSVSREAAALGVQKGWVIKSINGTSVEALDFDSAYRLFKHASSQLKVEAPTDARGLPLETPLQRALHESCLQGAGIGDGLQGAGIGDAQAPQPPQVVPGAARQLMDLLAALGLERLDVGSTNLSEGGTLLSNQCFYLAIARSWLADAADARGVLVRDSALALKREIEARVLRVRGPAALRDLGEEREAYADYLGCALQREGPDRPDCATADLAIAVFASCSGGLEAYEGSGYSGLPREQRVANLSLIWHRVGHFEAVVAAGGGGKADLTLEELLRQAKERDIAAAVVRA